MKCIHLESHISAVTVVQFDEKLCRNAPLSFDVRTVETLGTKKAPSLIRQNILYLELSQFLFVGFVLFANNWIKLDRAEVIPENFVLSIFKYRETSNIIHL